MRRIWSCLFYGLCAFAIAFSLFWMVLPHLEAPAPSADEEPIASQPNVLAQAEPAAPAAYWLCDKGGRVAVYECSADGEPEKLLEMTNIYVNLLPESDALRIKQGLTLHSEKELYTLLEDLGR